MLKKVLFLGFGSFQCAKSGSLPRWPTLNTGTRNILLRGGMRRYGILRCWARSLGWFHSAGGGCDPSLEFRHLRKGKHDANPAIFGRCDPSGLDFQRSRLSQVQLYNHTTEAKRFQDSLNMVGYAGNCGILCQFSLLQCIKYFRPCTLQEAFSTLGYWRVRCSFATGRAPLPLRLKASKACQVQDQLFDGAGVFGTSFWVSVVTGRCSLCSYRARATFPDNARHW